MHVQIIMAQKFCFRGEGYMKAHFHVKLQDQDAENRPYLVVGWGYLLYRLFCALTSTACDRN